MVTHFRNDDVSMNTDFFKLDEIYNSIHDVFPDAEIWSCVTIFARSNTKGTIYPQVPFKSKPFDYFLEVDRVLDKYKPPSFVKIVSHGLWHLNHADISDDLQEASIVTSCNILDTTIFVPPFNYWNKTTEDICRKHDIELIKTYDREVDPSDFIWRSIEHNEFNPAHNKWYFHSWAWDRNSLMKKLTSQARNK